MVKFKYLSCSKPESGGRTGEDRGGQMREERKKGRGPLCS